MENEAIARLRRALADCGDDVEVSELAYFLMQGVINFLPEGKALVYERILGCYAAAVEEPGPDASPHEIRDRAHLIAKRPH